MQARVLKTGVLLGHGDGDLGQLSVPEPNYPVEFHFFPICLQLFSLICDELGHE